MRTQRKTKTSAAPPKRGGRAAASAARRPTGSRPPVAKVARPVHPAKTVAKPAATPRTAATSVVKPPARRTAALRTTDGARTAGKAVPVRETAAGRKPSPPARPAAPVAPAPKDAPKRARPAPAPQAAVATATAPAEPKEKPGRKPKPPAKTMQVPAPMTDILVKRALPDVRRVAASAMLKDAARGFSSPSGRPRHREHDSRAEPPVDATLIAASLGGGTHPKIEDNYDYSVVEELVASPHCPLPTRMVNTGCGGGEAAVFFARRGYSVVGIDSDRTAVGLARERAWLAGVEIDFMVGDLFETPNLLPAESFGLAIDRGVFYRLSDDRDRQRYLTNIRRLLFQGGICYLSAGFFPLHGKADKPRARKASPKILLVREGGVVVSECRQAGFDVLHRVLRPTADSGEYGELLLYLRK